MTKKYITKVSNAVRLANSSYGINEARMFYMAFLEMINIPTFQDKYQVRIVDYVGESKISSGEYLYKEIQKIGTALTKKGCLIRTNDGWLAFAPVTEVRYVNGQGYLDISLNKNLWEALHVEKDYTRMDLRNFLVLKNPISKSVYDVFKRHKFKDSSIVYNIDDLRDELGLEGRYLLYGDFKRFVLVRSQADLFKQTDISFTFEELKKGRKVTQVRISIKNNESNKDPFPREEENTDTKKHHYGEDAVEQLIKYGLKKHNAIKLLDTYGQEHISETLKLVDEKITKGKVDDVSAFTSSAIRKNYVDDKKKGDAKKNKKKANTTNDLHQKEQERKKEQEIESKYYEQVFQEFTRVTKDENYDSIVDAFLEEQNDWFKGQVLKHNISHEQFPTHRTTKVNFADFVSSNYLDEKWHNIENWKTSQNT